MHLNPNTFCVGPYTEVRVWADGSLNFCHCASLQEKSSSENIKCMTVDHYFSQSDSVMKARHALESGQAVGRCKICYQAEENQTISFRQRRNIQAAIFPGLDLPPSAQQWFDVRQHQNLAKPLFYHVSFSNVCNLACMMCHPSNSTRLNQDLQRAGIQHVGPVYKSWTHGPEWQKFCDHLLHNDQIVCLHIMGGEPLLDKKFYELLDFLIQAQHTDFHLTFVTNGTVYRDDLIQKLSYFKSAVVEISLETVGKANEYIRYYSSTEKVVKNIQSFAAAQTDTISVVLRTVPQVLSVFEYATLLDFAIEHNLCVDSNRLNYYDFLKTNILPDATKRDLVAGLQRFVSHKSFADVSDLNLRNKHKLTDNIATNAKFVIHSLNEPCVDLESNRRKFAEYCVRMDQFRGTRLKTAVPELAEFAQGYGYNI